MSDIAIRVERLSKRYRIGGSLSSARCAIYLWEDTIYDVLASL